MVQKACEIEVAYALKNQKDLDILAEYLGESAELFEYDTQHASRAIFRSKDRMVLSGEGLSLVCTYLDLNREKSEVKLTLQLGSQSQVVGVWSLTDPAGVGAVREAAKCAILCISHSKGVKSK